MSVKNLILKGARQNNLKNIELVLPHNKVIAITGVSGSGKSSLAFDTVFAEGQWRFNESLSTYARLFLEKLDRPDVDEILNIRPAIALDDVLVARVVLHRPRIAEHVHQHEPRLGVSDHIEHRGVVPGAHVVHDRGAGSEGSLSHFGVVGVDAHDHVWPGSAEQGIQENASFFSKIQPNLQAGQPTGWDIVVFTNGWGFAALVANDWVVTLDTTKRPTFDRYAEPFAADPPFDPRAKHSMAYQSGLTGIGVNTELVDAEITTLDDLADPAKLPPDSVGMIKADTRPA